ncbi:MAG: signal peptidase I [Candidatus Bathyarchaeia archaeon]
MTTPRYRRLWKNEYFQTAITIVLIVVVVFGFWFGLRFALNTDYPMLAVASGSMCLVQPNQCDGWSHPFARTLHTGDLIIIQGVNASDIHSGPYPVGDILVFHKSPGSDELIVHRAIGETMVDGQIVFITQGDANNAPGPPPGGLVPANLVVGKVILRIPWIGHLALFMRDQSGVYLILALIIIIIAVEVVISIPGSKETEPKKDKIVDKTPQT